jgi:hypothetical protein
VNVTESLDEEGERRHHVVIEGLSPAPRESETDGDGWLSMPSGREGGLTLRQSVINWADESLQLTDTPPSTDRRSDGTSYVDLFTHLLDSQQLSHAATSQKTNTVLVRSVVARVS